jgi:hypothetical protein
MGLVLAAMIGSIDVTPVLGKDNHKRMEKHDNGRHGHKGRGHEHYVYRERVYAPPPVIYEPPPPPGISIFLPSIFIPIR